MQSFLPLVLLIAAYLIGSIPFSYLVVRLFAGDDIRTKGSGNVGATNVLRNFGKLPGIIALVLDVAKGFLAVLLVRYFVHSPAWPLPFSADAGPLQSPSFWVGLASLVAVLGHMYPVWIGFRGGKGVATAAGVFLASDPWSLAGGLIIFAVVVLGTRYVSLASMLTAASIPIFMRFLTGQTFWILIFSILIALTIIIRHHQNISRLALGTERKLGRRKENE